MPSQLYSLFQSLRIETDDTQKKAFLVSNLQCWVCQFQYLRFNSISWTSQNNLEIIVVVANAAISQTEIMWSGEQKIEIPYNSAERQLNYTVNAHFLKKTDGGVTNTISGSGGTIPV